MTNEERQAAISDLLRAMADAKTAEARIGAFLALKELVNEPPKQDAAP